MRQKHGITTGLRSASNPDPIGIGDCQNTRMCREQRWAHDDHFCARETYLSEKKDDGHGEGRTSLRSADVYTTAVWYRTTHTMSTALALSSITTRSVAGASKGIDIAAGMPGTVWRMLSPLAGLAKVGSCTGARNVQEAAVSEHAAADAVASAAQIKPRSARKSRDSGKKPRVNQASTIV